MPIIFYKTINANLISYSVHKKKSLLSSNLTCTMSKFKSRMGLSGVEGRRNKCEILQFCMDQLSPFLLRGRCMNICTSTATDNIYTGPGHHAKPTSWPAKHIATCLGLSTRASHAKLSHSTRPQAVPRTNEIAAASYPAKRRPAGGGRPTSTHASLSAIPSAAGSASARREAQLAALGCFFPAAASCVSSPRSSLYSLYWLLVVLLFLNNWNVWMITARSGEQQLLSPYENLLLYDSMCIL